MVVPAVLLGSRGKDGHYASDLANDLRKVDLLGRNGRASGEKLDKVMEVFDETVTLALQDEHGGVHSPRAARDGRGAIVTGRGLRASLVASAACRVLRGTEAPSNF